jgi:hypothetical protein
MSTQWVSAAPAPGSPAATPAGPPPTGSLAWLLDPITPEEFAADYWEKKALVIERADADYFGDLPGLNDVDELITATSSGLPAFAEDVRVIKTDDKGVLSEHPPRVLPSGLPDIQTIYRDYQGGCSLAVNQLHRRSASLAALSGLLEEDLHHPVGVNLYLTPRSAQGFRAHVDTHDVFILQMHGTKDWFFSTPDVELPLPAMKPLCDQPETAYRKITLRVGDVLYLPRGFPHYARTTDTSSLHYTVGVDPYRWIDFMTEALHELAETDPRCRHAVPLGFFDLLTDGAAPRDFAQRLSGRLGDEVFVERVRQRLEARRLRGNKATAAGHFASLDEARNLTVGSTVTRVPGVHCRVRQTADSAIIDFVDNYVSGPALVAPALRFIARNRGFAVADLPGDLSAEDKIDLVERLVDEGLLQIARTSSGPDPGKW